MSAFFYKGVEEYNNLEKLVGSTMDLKRWNCCLLSRRQPCWKCKLVMMSLKEGWSHYLASKLWAPNDTHYSDPEWFNGKEEVDLFASKLSLSSTIYLLQVYCIIFTVCGGANLRCEGIHLGVKSSLCPSSTMLCKTKQMHSWALLKITV